MSNYDPNTAPDAAQWLALGDLERIEAVGRAHGKLSLGDPKRDRLHAILHAVVENQLAGNNPTVVGTTMARFRAAGVGRHEALHAISSVMAQFMFGAMSQEEAFDEARYVAKLEALDPADWRGKSGRKGP